MDKNMHAKLNSFRIAISDEVIADLHLRLARTFAGQPCPMEPAGRLEPNRNTCGSLLTIGKGPMTGVPTRPASTGSCISRQRFTTLECTLFMSAGKGPIQCPSSSPTATPTHSVAS